jgi:hypothetical protein
MRWTGCVAYMAKIMNTSKLWPEKPEEEREFQRTRLT